MSSQPEMKYRMISEWSGGFKKLYERNDRNRAPEEFWNASMAHLSSVGEAIRRYDYLELLKSAAHAFCWMCCYINKCNETTDPFFKIENSFSQIVGFKYPKICGHCTNNICSCKAVEMDELPDKSSKYERLYNNWTDTTFDNYTLRKWLDMFWDIFNQNIHLLALENIGFHLLEEAGEQALAVRQLVQLRGITHDDYADIEKLLNKISNIDGLYEEYSQTTEELVQYYKLEDKNSVWKNIQYTDTNPIVIKARIIKGKMDFVIEFADTFSWFCAVLLKLERIIEKEILPQEVKEVFDIERVLQDRYKSGSSEINLLCYACGKDVCECRFYPKEHK